MEKKKTNIFYFKELGMLHCRILRYLFLEEKTGREASSGPTFLTPFLLKSLTIHYLVALFGRYLFYLFILNKLFISLCIRFLFQCEMILSLD